MSSHQTYQKNQGQIYERQWTGKQHHQKDNQKYPNMRTWEPGYWGNFCRSEWNWKYILEYRTFDKFYFTHEFLFSTQIEEFVKQIDFLKVVVIRYFVIQIFSQRLSKLWNIVWQALRLLIANCALLTSIVNLSKIQKCTWESNGSQRQHICSLE